MNNQEHRMRLLELATDLYQATSENRPDKLQIKMNIRDAIEEALAGGVAQSIAHDLRDNIAPFCLPFDEERYLDLCVLAEAVAEGRSALLKAYKIRILQADLG
ncbi:hypothetical protein [Pseudomonas piscis]|uniref:Uncharacterized protein n=1 Tax=Pseudomonas piscis TaxID=2614538 RepID=A0A7X1U462_9PSED|nr:hypothetical protein [Pseudomonas piscis]MQA54122.1 hypothetical protein [Pseudomonas piscis]